MNTNIINTPSPLIKSFNINNFNLSSGLLKNKIDISTPVISIEITEKAIDIINNAKLNKIDIELNRALYKIVIENNELYNKLFNINKWGQPLFNIIYAPSYNENVLVIDICCVNNDNERIDVMEIASTVMEI